MCSGRPLANLIIEILSSFLFIEIPRSLSNPSSGHDKPEMKRFEEITIRPRLNQEVWAVVVGVTDLVNVRKVVSLSTDTHAVLSVPTGAARTSAYRVLVYEGSQALEHLKPGLGRPPAGDPVHLAEIISPITKRYTSREPALARPILGDMVSYH